MSSFFGMLLTVSLIAFVVGMVKPKLIMRWAPEEKQNRKWVALVTIACMVVFSFLAAHTMTPEEKAAQQAKQEQQLQEKEAKKQAEAEKKAAEEKAKAEKEAAEKQAKEEKDKKASATINIDWDKAIAATKNDILQQEKMVKDVYIKVDGKSIEIYLECNNAINQEAAAEAADTAVRRLSGNAQMQDSSIKSGSKDYWGGIWDVYELKIGVAKSIDVEKRGNWLIDDVVQPGVQGKHKFKGLKRM